MRLLHCVLTAALAVMLTGCYGRSDAEGPGTHDVPNANTGIASLVAMYRGQTATINEDITIAGRVTSSDRAGNFRYSFMVEQQGAAVEVLAHLTDLHNIYPVGSSVAIRLKGMAMGQRMGVVCLGMPAAEYDYYPVDYIWSRVELDSRIVRTHDPEPFGIPVCYVSMLGHGMCGRIVRVMSLRRVDDEPARDTSDVAGPPAWGGYTIFEDTSDEGGRRIAVYVSEYANFAGRQVPESVVSATGVLQYGRPTGAGEDMFILKPRDANDILPY